MITCRLITARTVVKEFLGRNDMTNAEAIRILTLECDDWETSHCTPMVRREAFEMAINALKAQPEHTSNNDCNGCKFVGCYDTDFPCANCIRKNKDYYDPERRTDESD